MSLYNFIPKTTIKGFGYKDEETAIETIKKLKKLKKGKVYEF